MIEATTARGNFDHTTIAAPIINHVSRSLTIQITAVAVIISRIEIAFITINTTIASIIAAVVSTIAGVVVAVVTVAADSFTVNKAFAISVTDETSEIVAHHHAIVTAIAATHPIQ